MATPFDGPSPGSAPMIVPRKQPMERQGQVLEGQRDGEAMGEVSECVHVRPQNPSGPRASAEAKDQVEDDVDADRDADARRARPRTRAEPPGEIGCGDGGRDDEAGVAQDIA